VSETDRKTTAIAGYDAESISVRGKDLVNELMGHLSFSEMIAFQLLGTKPSPAQVKILDAVMVTIMEHGLVPSALVTRLTHAGAPESFQGAVAAGLLGVGERYAGTASECARLLDDIVAATGAEREKTARRIVEEHRERKRPVPGFGHPVHRDGDPRSLKLIEIAEEAGAEGSYIAALRVLEAAVEDALGKRLPTNISAGIAAALGEAGIPAKAMRGIVLTARCAGLAGHLVEEMDNPLADDVWQSAQREAGYDPDR